MRALIGLLLIFCQQSRALTQPEALNLSKSRIQELARTFSQLSYNCFIFEADCQIKSRNQEITLKWISEELSKYPARIQFASGKDQFLIDGAIRIAKTGEAWNTPVIFNEDLLSIEGTPGNFQALGFFEILGVLVHEFGHHQEQMMRQEGLVPLEHPELDEVAVKVVTYLKDRTRQIKISQSEVPGLKEGYELTILQTDIEWYNGVRNLWSNIFVDGIGETVEISRSLVAGARCPRGYTSGHLTFIGVPYYAAFRQVQAPKIQFQNNQLNVDQDIGDASVLCADETQGVYQVFDGFKRGHVHINFTLNGEGKLIYQPGSSSFKADPPPDENSRQGP
jgi:hypothetical protein